MNAIYNSIPAHDPKAREIIISVIEGKTAPEDGALRLKSVWFPIEGMRDVGPSAFSRSREDSILQLNALAVALLENMGQRLFSRRLAELSYCLAEQIDDLVSMVVCGATLVQVMTGDLPANKRRLELAEFVVPELKRLGTSEESMGIMLMQLADARFLASRDEPSLIKLAIEAGNEALAYKKKLSALLLGRVYFILGTSYNELLVSEENLNKSIQCFSQALTLYKSAPDTSDEDYGTLYNNWGNSYRDLGGLTADRYQIEKAIEYYQYVLSEIAAPRSIALAKGNMQAAVEMLTVLQRKRIPSSKGFFGRLRRWFNKPRSILDENKHSAVLHQKPKQAFERLLRRGDDLFYVGQTTNDDKEKEDNIREAVSTYLDAIKQVDRKNIDSDMAMILHRLGITFMHSTEDDDMWTAFCFANAARRLAGDGWDERTLARVDFHKGKVLTIIGYPDNVEYLSKAVALINSSLPGMSTSRNEGEYESVQNHYRMALSMLESCKGEATVRNK